MLALATLWVPCANGMTHGPKRTTIHAVIVHTISGPTCKAGKVVYTGADGDASYWKSYFDRHPFIGIHYIIDRSGTVLASVPEDETANHALGHNDDTIGIELVHEGDGVEPFGDKQVQALITLLKDIRARYNISIEDIKGHTDIDSRSFTCGDALVKSRPDPGANFPWSTVRLQIAN